MESWWDQRHGNSSSIRRSLQSPPQDPLLSPRATLPSRPQTTPRPTRSPAVSQLSPRFLVAQSPREPQLPKYHSSPRCKSAEAHACHPKSTYKASSHRSSTGATLQSSRRSSDGDAMDAEEQHPRPYYEMHSAELPVNQQAREHIDLKACMLAHMHRIDVDNLQEIREQAMQELKANQVKHVLREGGVLDDGSLLETSKRKTSFLLRHFFALGSSRSSKRSHEDGLLYDVVDEWTCYDHASEAEVASLWKSIQAHIERSYLLRRQLVPHSDPDPLSTIIAMDCLKKLPARLPAYQRVLDVIVLLLETALFLPSSSESFANQDTPAAQTRRRFYFEEHAALLARKLEREARDRAEEQERLARATPIQQILKFLEELETEPDAGERDKFYLTLMRGYLRRFVGTALHAVLEYIYPDKPKKENENKSIFLSMWMARLSSDDLQNTLISLSQHHTSGFQTFLQENLDAMDKLLMEIPANASSESGGGPTRLFQKLIERHPTEFSAVLLQSPYLTAHIFQESQHLVARILEQNIILLSNVLQQRADVFLALLNHTLRDNATVVEEFLMNHPKAFSDLLLNRPAAIATAIKTYPTILADVIQTCRPTLASVLLATPSVLCQLLKATPELLAQTIREDMTLLPLAFSLVPQSLSDSLERHPEHFVDIANRKPALVSRLFAKYPDLLLEPLEANPSVFSNFLVYHRKILPDISDPNVNPDLLQFERKKYIDQEQQTEKRMWKYDGKRRLREKIKVQEELIGGSIRSVSVRTASPAPTSGSSGTTVVTGISNGATVIIPTPAQVIVEIAKIYVKMIAADALDDLKRCKRQNLPDFVLSLYIQELGFKSKAQKKLTSLLVGAKQFEQESLRVKWFLRLMNADAYSIVITGSSSFMLSTSSANLGYHPLSSAFYLLVLQFLLPIDQMQQILAEEIFKPCLVSYERVREFLDESILIRMLPAREQRQQLLQSLCEREHLLHGASASSGEIGSSGARSSWSSGTPTTFHLDDVLEAFLIVWLQYQNRIREDWIVQFQITNPDGSGVVSYRAFAELIRTKLSSIDDRGMMKIYNQCGEENDLGEYFLVAEDFALAVSILQEEDAIRTYMATTMVFPTEASDTGDEMA